MKFIFVSLISLLSLTTFAQSLKLTPGLWSVKVYSLENGKRVDMMETINKQLALLPKEQRESMMKAMGASVASEQCITQEMLSNPDKFSNDKKFKDCKVVAGKFTASHYSSTLKCEDGKEMYTEITAKGDKSFITRSVMKLKGETQEVEVTGTFVGDKCK